MNVSREELILSEPVPALRESNLSITPPSGSEVIIHVFSAEGLYSLNSAAKLIWDFEGAGEETIWSIRGSGKMPFTYIIPSSDTNGIKKLAIACDNGESSANLMGAYAKIQINTQG